MNKLREKLRMLRTKENKAKAEESKKKDNEMFWDKVNLDEK